MSRFAIAAGGGGKVTVDNTIKQQILEAEEKLRRAMLYSDTQALESLLAPELLFTNHFGQPMSKHQDIDAHASGTLKIDEINLTEQEIMLLWQVAVVSVRADIVGSYEGRAANGNFRFTRVWAISPTGSWHVVAGHSSLIV